MTPTTIKFKVTYDSTQLQRELSQCLQLEWPSHFKPGDFQGDWNSISLRSVTGSVNDIYAHPTADAGYKDTPLLLKMPYIKSIVDSWKCDKEAIRLLSLTPGSVIKPHQDLHCAYKHGIFRIHIPITTNPGVYFTVGENCFHLQEGECWYMDFSTTHSIVNEGNTNRVHLLIDGIRNEWTDKLFEEHGYPAYEEQYDEDTASRIIAELALMNTAASKTIIKEFKNRSTK